MGYASGLSDVIQMGTCAAAAAASAAAAANLAITVAAILAGCTAKLRFANSNGHDQPAHKKYVMCNSDCDVDVDNDDNCDSDDDDGDDGDDVDSDNDNGISPT